MLVAFVGGADLGPEDPPDFPRLYDLLDPLGARPVSAPGRGDDLDPRLLGRRDHLIRLGLGDGHGLVEV